MEETVERIPVIKSDLEISGSINDWNTSNSQMQSSLKLYVYCFNINTKTWEPFIGLCPGNDGQYIPWTLTFKVSRENCSAVNNFRRWLMVYKYKIIKKVVIWKQKLL